MRTKLWGLLGLIVIALAFTVTSRQMAAQDQCPVLVEQALDSLNQTCSSVDRNSVCYGYNVVSAEFSQPMPENFFSKPSDQAELVQLQRVYTTPFDVTTGQWGLALMNVQANIPDTLPGQGVIFILMGNAEVQNQVNPAEIPNLSQSVKVWTFDSTNLRSAPSLQANVLDVAPANSELQADMRSEDDQWLRVLRNNVPMWIHRDVIRVDQDVNILPQPRRTRLSPMQSFRFSTGIGQPQCHQAQDALIIQGPNNVVVDIEANGAVIQIASTVMLTRSADNHLQLTTLSGNAYVDGVRVPAGYTSSAPLGTDGNVQTTFSAAQPVSQAQLEQLNPVESIQPEMMHYQVDLPTLDQIRSTNPVHVPSNDPPPQHNGGDNPGAPENGGATPPDNNGGGDQSNPGGDADNGGNGNQGRGKDKDKGNGNGNNGNGNGNGGGNGTGNEGGGNGNGNNGNGNGNGGGNGNGNNGNGNGGGNGNGNNGNGNGNGGGNGNGKGK